MFSGYYLRVQKRRNPGADRLGTDTVTKIGIRAAAVTFHAVCYRKSEYEAPKMCTRVRAYARMREVPKGTIQYLRNLHYRYCIVNSTPRFYIGFVTLMSTMSENGMNYLELEYEHLYNMRDQTMLFLKLYPKTTGLAEEMLDWLDQKVKMLGKELEKHP